MVSDFSQFGVIRLWIVNVNKSNVWTPSSTAGFLYFFILHRWTIIRWNLLLSSLPTSILIRIPWSLFLSNRLSTSWNWRCLSFNWRWFHNGFFFLLASLLFHECNFNSLHSSFLSFIIIFFCPAGYDNRFVTGLLDLVAYDWFQLCLYGRAFRNRPCLDWETFVKQIKTFLVKYSPFLKTVAYNPLWICQS